MKRKLVIGKSILAVVGLRSNQNRPETMIFNDFDTFLAWRFEHIDDIQTVQLQECSSLILVPVLESPDLENS